MGKRLGLIAILLFIIIQCISAQYSRDSLWFRTHYTKSEEMIPMRDGIHLFTSIYRPIDTLTKHPILMVRTPYSCYPYGLENYKNYFGNYWNNYLRAGYILVTQDVRGRYMSEGTYEDIRPLCQRGCNGKETDEATDTYDAIEWLTKNAPGNNGKVGITGISYPGFYATTASVSGHPALKAVSPQAPVTDWYRGDDFHHNGAFALMDGFGFYLNFGQPRPEPTRKYKSVISKFSDDAYDFFLRQGSLADIKEKYYGNTIQFWNDLFAHPDLDTFWQSRSPLPHLKQIKPAMMVVGGLFDAEDCYGAWHTYKAITEQSPTTNTTLVMGPWYHGNWGGRGTGSGFGNVQFGQKTSEWYQNEFEFPFFNYYLNGDQTAPTGSKANIYYTGENQWHYLNQWPPAGTKEKKIYLSENYTLSMKPAEKANGQDTYISDSNKPVPYVQNVGWDRTREYMLDDQRFASTRTDVLTYESEILQQDLTFTGPIIADLFVKISTTDADFVVKVIDRFPDDFADYSSETTPMRGYEMLVRGEIMRGRYRNSFSKPEPFKPGKVTRVQYTLPDIAHTFKKGHRLIIQIQSSWFPLFDRNPQQFVNIYTAKKSDFVKSTIDILRTAQYPSAIIFQSN